MGMRDAFYQNKPYFPGMSDRETHPFPSNVSHKSFVEINEQGMKAASGYWE